MTAKKASLKETITIKEKDQKIKIPNTNQDIDPVLVKENTKLKADNANLLLELSVAEDQLDVIIDRLNNIVTIAKKKHKERSVGPRGLFFLIAKGLQKIIEDYNKEEEEKAKKAKE